MRRDILRTIDVGGAKLNVVRYRIPPPRYSTAECSRPRDRAKQPELLAGLHAAALEVDQFATILDRSFHGLGSRLRAQAPLGRWGTAYRELTDVLTGIQRLGLTPILLRAVEVETDEEREKFLAAWLDREGRKQLATLADLILTVRDKVAEEDLGERLKAVGLKLRATGGSPSAPRHALRAIAWATSGKVIDEGGKERAFDLAEGGCGGCRDRFPEATAVLAGLAERADLLRNELGHAPETAK